MPYSSCLSRLEFAQQLSLNPCSLAIKELVGPRTLAMRPALSLHLTTLTPRAAPAAEQAIGPTIERSILPGTEVEELLRHWNHSPPRPNIHIEILTPMIK